MKVFPYIIPPHLTKINGHHTWLGTELPNHNYLFILTGTSYNYEHSEEFLEWFTKNDGTKIYIQYRTCFIMPRDLFDEYFRSWIWLKKHPEADDKDFIIVHNSKRHRIGDFNNVQWEKICKYSSKYAKIYDPRVAQKPSTKGKVITIIFIILPILALALGLGLGLGLK